MNTEAFIHGCETALKDVIDEMRKPLMKYSYSILLNYTDAVPAIINYAELYFLPVFSEDGEYIGPDYKLIITDTGEIIDPIASLYYALEQLSLKEDDLFYTWDQIDEWWDNGTAIEHSTDIRQPHMIPDDPVFMDYQINEDGIIYGIDLDGIKWVFNAPPGFCDNTYFLLHEGRRVCGSCGYVFSIEQDIEIGLFD